MAYTPAQQKRNRAKWVKALRSGKYKQARGCLSAPETDGMCCLGVACEISGLGKWVRAYGDNSYLGQNLSLPTAVKDWLGLTDHIGRFNETPSKITALSEKNDDGASFAQLADIIEREPPGLILKGDA